MIKQLIILFTTVFFINTLNAQSIKRDVFEIRECVLNNSGKLMCDNENVNYEIIINTDLSFIFLLNKESHEKIFAMDIINHNRVIDDIWLYELISENEIKYDMIVDMDKEIIRIYPIQSLHRRNFILSSVVLRFKNPIRL